MESDFGGLAECWADIAAGIVVAAYRIVGADIAADVEEVDAVEEIDGAVEFEVDNGWGCGSNCY